MYAWRAAGVSLPHSSAAQYASLPHVSQSQVAPGDLVFFGSPIHHVGIYIGGGQMVSAPHTGTVVKVQSAFRSDYVGAARPG
jgi:cell wall-associated NlpC family hydrolase